MTATYHCGLCFQVSWVPKNSNTSNTSHFKLEIFPLWHLKLIVTYGIFVLIPRELMEQIPMSPLGTQKDRRGARRLKEIRWIILLPELSESVTYIWSMRTIGIGPSGPGLANELTPAFPSENIHDKRVDGLDYQWGVLLRSDLILICSNISLSADETLTQIELPGRIFFTLKSRV